MPVTDIELMLRVQAGDEAAFRELWERHAPGLLNYFYWYSLGMDEAEDATQEVFQRLWLARDKYVPKGRFLSYVYRIATNYLIDRSRAVKRRPASVSLDASFGGADESRPRTLKDQLPGQSPQPDESLDSRETRERIREAVERLPESQRVVFVLGVQEGVKYSEIGRILGIPEGTVKSRMHTAVHSLRESLSKKKGFR